MPHTDLFDLLIAGTTNDGPALPCVMQWSRLPGEGWAVTRLPRNAVRSVKGRTRGDQKM